MQTPSDNSRVREITVLCALTDFDTKKINSRLIWTVTNTDSYDAFRQTLEECLHTAYTPDETARMIKDAETRAHAILDRLAARNAAEDPLHRISIITELDPAYPAAFSDLADDRPVILFMQGSPALLNANTISIIGSRWPTEAGITAGNRLADTLISLSAGPASFSTSTKKKTGEGSAASRASAQIPVIVSGLANGCDTIGHRAALRNGIPTIAVLPGGFDHIAPANNRPLTEEILTHGGALLTEYLPETEVENRSYLRRDRLVAALSRAVAVIQCDRSSGTMYTVNCASHLARPICALTVPAGADPAAFTGNTHIIENNIGRPISDPSADLPAFLDTVKTGRNKPKETTQQLRFI